MTNSFKDAAKKKIENLEERIERLENQVRPTIKAVETENGKKLVLEPATTSKWINPEYMDKVLSDIGLELSDLDVEQDSDGNYSSGDDVW